MIDLSVMFGNLTTEEILSRLGITVSDDEHKKLENLRDDNANVPKGKWHGFDMPFEIVCGDVETAKVVYGILSKYEDQFKRPLQISCKNHS